MTTTAWLTILAIVLGPILAVTTQLWMQGRNARRDQKLWVFSTLMGHRATYYVNEAAVQAFNMIDVVFYGSTYIREKRKEFLAIVNTATGRELKPDEKERCEDLMSEMLAKMGRELGFEFGHTEIKGSAYLPQGLVTMPIALLAVLQGRQSISVDVKTADQQAKPPVMGHGVLGRRQ